MKKEDVFSLVVYFIMIAAAIVVGLTALSNMLDTFSPNHPFGLVLGCIALALVINVIFLEVCHVIGAYIGGYKVVSFNVLGLCLEKKNGKWSFRFKDFDGLTGETKIAPNKEKLNLKPFVWFPIFGYAVEMASCIVLISQINQAESDTKVGWLAIAAMLFITVSSMIALYNLVPLKLDSMTDGYRLVLLSRKTNTEAYNELLRIEELEREGKEIGEVKIFEEITEFTANLNLISIYKNLENHNYEEAEKLIDMILVNPKKVEPITKNRLIAQKLYVSILNKAPEEAKKIYNEITDDQIRRFIANDSSLESVRAYLLISTYIEESFGEFQIAKRKITKAKKNTLPSRLKVEEQLLKETFEKIYKTHPDWEKENSAE